MAARLLDNDDCCVLLVLPGAYRALLLDWATRLHWSIYVDENGKRKKPNDEQEAMLQRGYMGLVDAMCMDDLLLVLTGIKTAIENIESPELTLDLTPLVAAVGGVQTAVEGLEFPVDNSDIVNAIGGVQTAIENQVLTIDLSALESWLLGIQTAIENQVLTIDLSALESWLLGIQTAIENQVLTIDLSALESWLLGIQTAIENQTGGGEVDFSQLEAVLIDIKTAIENLSEEDMSTINNIYCGCGCGSGSENKPAPIPPIDMPPDQVYPPEPEIPPYEEPDPTLNFTQYSCNAAHYLYYQFRLAVLHLGDLMATGQPTYNEVKGVLSDTLGLFGEFYQLLWTTFYSIVSWFVQNITETTVSEMVQEMDRHYEEFTCGLFSGDGAEEKRANFLAVIDSLSLPWPARYWLRLLEQNIDWVNWFYPDDWESIVFPPSYQQRTCCGMDEAIDIPSLPSLPPEETSYKWVYTPMTFLASVSIGDTRNYVVSQNNLVDGLLAAFQIQRNSTNGTAAAIVEATMKESRTSMETKFGATPFTPKLTGVMLMHSNYSANPPYPVMTNGIDKMTNFISSTPDITWINADKTLLLHDQTVGDEFIADGGLPGFTIKRVLTDNIYIATPSALAQVRVRLTTFSESEHRAYRITNHGLLRCMAIWKVPKP